MRHLNVQFPQSSHRAVNQMSAGLETVGLKGKGRRTEVHGGPLLFFSFHIHRERFTEHARSLSATRRQFSAGTLIYARGLLGKTMVLCSLQLSSTTGKAGSEGEGSQLLSAGYRN